MGYLRFHGKVHMTEYCHGRCNLLKRDRKGNKEVMLLYTLKIHTVALRYRMK